MKPMATASMAGVISNPVALADHLIATYLFAHPSGSTLSPKQQVTFSGRLITSGHSIREFCSGMAGDIKTVLEHYLDTAELDISYEEPNDFHNGLLLVRGQFTVDGEVYQLPSTIQREQSYILKALNRS